MKLLRQTIKSSMILLCLAISPVHAGVALQRLETFYKEVKSLQGDFTQTTFDKQSHIREHSEGSFAIQRPGKFHWDYKSPYKQLIVANNKKVWLYDTDLEQVTVEKLDKALGNTPAALLSSSESLQDNFKITELGAIGDLEWVELTPREKNTSFEQIHLGFDLHNLRAMELKDNFGHTTRLEFSNLRQNVNLPASLFVFTPPPGVDVIGN